MHIFECPKFTFWALEQKPTLVATGTGWLWILATFGLNRSGMSWILWLIKRHKTLSPITRLITCCASAYLLFRSGKPGVWGSVTKKKVHEKKLLPWKKMRAVVWKMLAAENIEHRITESLGLEGTSVGHLVLLKMRNAPNTISV